MDKTDLSGLPKELLEELPYAIFAIDPQGNELLYANAAGHRVMENPQDAKYMCYRNIFAGAKSACAAYQNTALNIPNRRKFDFDFQRELSLKGTKGAVVLLNLKGFNRINAEYGYEQANHLLAGIAAHLRANLPVTDAVYHSGSDKFLFLLPNIAEEMLRRFLSELSASFEKPWLFGGVHYPVACDIAAISYPEHGTGASELMQNLASALEISRKSNITNAITYFSQSIQEKVQKRAEIEWAMTRAIREDFKEFEVYYQPIIDAKSLKWGGCEALLRWRSSELGFLMPGSFLEIAEQTGMIKALGNFVLKTAVQFVQSLELPADYPFHLSYNLSPQQFYDAALVSGIKKVLDETAFPPRELFLEICRLKEKDKRDPQVLKNLRNLKSLNSGVALDDFGLDNSKIYDFTDQRGLLKVGRYITAGVETDSFMPVFMSTVMDLSNAMNLDVCAKGIETERQVKIMKDYDCTYLQGYYFSYPLTGDEFRKLLSDNI